MMFMRFAGVLAMLATLWQATACAAGPKAGFGPREDRGRIEHDAITEASGLVASRLNPGVLWTHNDSGSSGAVFALDDRGRHLARVRIEGCPPGDWEDIAAGPGPDGRGHFLYIGDIGDNSARKKSRSICRFPEPALDATARPAELSVQAERIRFVYPDGSHDAETLLADPATGQLHVVTKREKQVGLYRIPNPSAPEGTLTAERLGNLPYTFIVGGDISADGREILLKTYTAVLYWRRQPGQSIADTLQQPATSLPYVAEVGGEAIAWAADGSGYFTLSEENLGIEARLYFYPRQRPPGGPAR